MTDRPRPTTALVVLIGAALSVGVLLMVAAPDLAAMRAGKPPVTFEVAR
jgi:cytochrome c-type biogenesis protein CcmH/NrfG